MTQMPILFIGHGSPMNAIQDNAYTRALIALRHKFEKPRAILCISAHWMTHGTWVTGMSRPRTIHDFYGFPEELFKIQYPALGDPVLAESIARTVTDFKIQMDEKWGLDHGAWSVLKYLYPEAEIPVLQLSLSLEFSAEDHYRLGQQLQFLRKQGVLILGSGNIVHNLREIQWEVDAKPYDWAIEFDEWVKVQLIERKVAALSFKEGSMSVAAQRSIPTWDHYYPLLSILGASTSSDQLHFIYEGIQNASISMRCLSFSS